MLILITGIRDKSRIYYNGLTMMVNHIHHFTDPPFRPKFPFTLKAKRLKFIRDSDKRRSRYWEQLSPKRNLQQIKSALLEVGRRCDLLEAFFGYHDLVASNRPEILEQ